MNWCQREKVLGSWVVRPRDVSFHPECWWIIPSKNGNQPFRRVQRLPLRNSDPSSPLTHNETIFKTVRDVKKHKLWREFGSLNTGAAENSTPLLIFKALQHDFRRALWTTLADLSDTRRTGGEFRCTATSVLILSAHFSLGSYAISLLYSCTVLAFREKKMLRSWK